MGRLYYKELIPWRTMQENFAKYRYPCQTLFGFDDLPAQS